MSINKDFHLTQTGIEELKKELEQLKARRLQVADKLKSAKEQGDLSENSDWSSAQDEFKFVEGRINEIEHILQNAEIITAPKNRKEIQLGSKVELEHDGRPISYTIVGSIESNPDDGKISDESPIGKALMGKKIDELVDIRTPSGNTAYRILKIT